ncbi:beta-glucosidase BglX [Lactobacillus paragasseri]|uniref:beta-glucosidase BglX n=1 Tax=Lactobacillus TaxID=1578 RepID=UPI0006658F55|nr:MULTISPECIES: beta-glucosidase BglX [Lactobacillus]MDE3334952.1 beta-glucosidase BglX [Lactobacillus paragasseri]MDE3383976.1 beta-glucosidase BglX [Lactobacillus paragasseri]MDE3398516.1 beta-glucosidase BglX [Lactobacillus paragasseri]MDK7120346.1 beta-glucosidase BglX [Lactobacillus paragasseri]MDX5080645.1 beta-glucosidase BglX [Lactobacillus paragasseri]
MKQKELKALLDDMSLDEKIGQLVQLSGEFLQANDISYGPREKLGITKETVNLIGSVLNVAGAKATRKVQDMQMRVQPHHIPVLFMSDVIYGYKTVYPIPLGLGATWNPKLVENAFQKAANEASAAGIQVAYAPMIDVVHDARWGRVLESPGEDPYLNSVYAKSMVNGFQKKLGEKQGVVSCFKHYAAYGDVESGREYNTVDMSLSNLFQNYLPPYKAAVKAGAKMAMTSLASLNGVPSTADKWLLDTVLRREWGFKGIIISDYASIYELIKHGFAGNIEQAAKKAIDAGVDIDMKSPCYAKGLKSLVTDGKLDEEKINQATWRILCLKNELGLFENPYFGISEEKESNKNVSLSNRKLARKLATESLVLLKNKNGALPLHKEEKAVLIGPYADNHQLLGMWAIHGNSQDTVSILEGMQKYNPDIKVAKGTDINRNRHLFEEMGFFSEKQIDQLVSAPEVEKENNQEALKLAAGADTVVLALGENSLESGEAGAKTNLCLPDNQLKLIKDISKLGKKIVVLVISGRPLVLTNIVDKVDAIIECWFPGTEGGNAIADVLFGKENPSGRLSMTFPYDVGQEPIYYNHFSTGRPYHGSQHKGRFVSKYLDAPVDPLYPFGYGLSYGKTKIKNIELSNKYFKQNGKVKVKVNLENTSDWDQKEVIQLYIHDKVAGLVQPVKRLIDFTKVDIKRHSEEEVSFEISPNQLAYFDNTGKEVVEKGEFDIFVGKNSMECLSTKLELI